MILLIIDGNKGKRSLKSKAYLLKMMEIGKKWIKKMMMISQIWLMMNDLLYLYKY